MPSFPTPRAKSHIRSEKTDQEGMKRDSTSATFAGYPGHDVAARAWDADQVLTHALPCEAVEVLAESQ
jgi:hypothetical protein